MREIEVEMLPGRKDLCSKGPILDILGTFRRCPLGENNKTSFCKIFKKGENLYKLQTAWLNFNT